MPGSYLSIRKQCELLNVHRSRVYYCPKADLEDTNVMNLIAEIHKSHPYYGYRKIRCLLANEGLVINSKKVLRLMRLMGIRPIYAGIRTSIPGNGVVYPYLLKGLIINRVNQVWAIDITYIKLPTGVIYLFALIDWHSRYVVSHIVANTMEAYHAVDILELALIKNKPEICNADQGSQFTGQLWINMLQQHDIQVSHDGVGRCIDNIRIERLWRTIKYEDVFLQS